MRLAFAIDALLVAFLYVSLRHWLARGIGVRPHQSGVSARYGAAALNVPVLVAVILVITLSGQPLAYIDPNGDFSAAIDKALA